MTIDPQRAQALFLAALELPDSAARQSLLNQECAGDDALRRRVDALLAAHDAVSGFGDELTGPGCQPTVDSSENIRPATIVAGRYKLIETIGEGGMGTVWLAEQKEPVKRKVAVKLVKPGMDSRAVLARFEAERQALAMMDHPNIARVLDGGVTEQGRPYFAMELVRGISITDYCDQTQLSIRERLALFGQVCSAVQHAHQKGIIHRDLKPSNILVTEHDSKPVVKVIDFGLAKALHGAHTLTELSMHTSFGSVLGTPLYMAPEQLGTSALDVDTRADMYSLGVILYELLTGSTPIERERLKDAAWDEIRRIVREEEPQLPSTRLSSSGGLASLAARRHVEPARLTRLVRGELDWIIMKAMEKDRKRRYETVSSFGQDVQRYLDGEPVQAAPPSRLYRLRKLARRHRAPVITASLLLLTLVIGVVGTTIGLFEAKRQQHRAEDAQRAEAKRAEGETLAKEKALRAAAAEKLAREKEEQERKYAEAISQFVKDDFLGLTSVEGQYRLSGEFGHDGLDRDATLMTLLDRAAAKLSARKDLNPQIEAELCGIIGFTYKATGAAVKGIPFLERSQELRRSLLGPEDPATLEASNSLALAYEETGNVRKALELLEQIREPYVRTLGPEDQATLDMLRNLASVYNKAGQTTQAIALFEQVRDACLKTLGANHEDTIHLLHDMAVAYIDAGRLIDAVALLEQVYDFNLKRLGPSHPDTLVTIKNLARAYAKTGQVQRGIELSELAHQGLLQTLEPNHPKTLKTLNDVATAYRAAGDYAHAFQLLEQLHEVSVREYGPDHPCSLSAMANLGQLYSDLGQLPKAIELLEQVRAESVKRDGVDHPDTLTKTSNLAMAYLVAGRISDATSLLEEVLNISTTKLGPDHLLTLATKANLGACFRNSGRLTDAQSLWEETLQEVRSKLPPDHALTIKLKAHLATLYWQLNRLDLSVPLFEEALEHYERVHGRQHLETLIVVANLGVNYLHAGRIAEALPLLEEAYAAIDEYPQLVSYVVFPLFNFYWNTGQLDKGLPLLENSRGTLQEQLGPEHPDTLRLMSMLGSAYWFEGKLDKSVPQFEETLKLFEKVKGRQDPETLGIVANLGINYRDAGRVTESIPLLEEVYEASKQNPSLSIFGPELLEAYIQAGDRSDKLLKMIGEVLDEARKEFPAESPEMSSLLAQFSLIILQMKEYDKAEPLIRECLTIREKNEPDVWSTFNAQSILGGVLLGQEKYSEAEPLLLAGYAGLKERESTIPAEAKSRLTESIERLVQLYKALENLDEAAKWQTRLDQLQAVEMD